MYILCCRIYFRVRVMDYHNAKSSTSEGNLDKAKKKQSDNQALEYATLSDMPLEDRRNEAKKPLFLIRYE